MATENVSQESPEPTEDWLRAEYESAQDSAHHHDNLVWTTTSIVWAGSLTLLGFVLDALKDEDGFDWKKDWVWLLPITLGTLLNVLLMIFTSQFRAAKKRKYDRCKQIEEVYNLLQHRRESEHWRGSQTCLLRLAEVLFILVWPAIFCGLYCRK